MKILYKRSYLVIVEAKDREEAYNNLINLSIDTIANPIDSIAYVKGSVEDTYIREVKE